ncbi:MAG: hypothetical protein LBB34_01645 [Holosporales bacterium]|jgi:hypothetical protein|nr:hypothetical protein [Holosporales bacterium]
MYSEILKSCTNGECIQRLIYWNRDNGKDITYGLPVVYNKSCIPILFDPWSGEWISESYEYSHMMAISDLQHRGKYICMYNDKFDIETEGPEELRGKDWLFKIFEEKKKLHSKERYCTSLESRTRYSERGDSSLVEIPNVRVVAILNKVKHGGWTGEQIRSFHWRSIYQGLEKWTFKGWTALDFCPFCGASLPERLDKKIIEVLRDEYCLTSWKDYKKAPHEFHTDEWWRKRGL